MFEALITEVEKIDALVLSFDGDALSELIGVSSRLRAKILEAVGVFDRNKNWDLDAATSMIAWLREHGRLTSREAARMAHTARGLEDLSAVADALADGRLSDGQVDAILACVPKRHRSLFAAQQDSIVETLVGLSVVDTARAMRLWQAHADAVADEDRPEPDDEPDSSLHLSSTLGGRGVLDGDLGAESTEIVSTALRLAESADTPDDRPRLPAQRRADALTDICKFFLDHQKGISGGRHRPHLNVVVDLDDLEAGRGGATVNGTTFDPATVSAMLCDCSMHRVLTKGRSTILDYGQATRTAPPNLFNALLVRDQHCRFGTCDRPGHWVDAHHVDGYANGGHTSIERMVLLCRRHHRRLHKRGWHGYLDRDGTFRVTDPSGRVIVSRPPRQQQRLLVT